uniref:RING-type domain-containing protein n=1 Tax=Acrobeloides nanus TaxID=290746 RepID=A0A914CDS4_9BILA
MSIPQPASETFINSLMPLPYRQQYENDSCRICMANFDEEPRNLIRVPCNGYHIFHEDCIKSWLRNSGTCPICRSRFSDDLITTNTGGLEAVWHEENDGEHLPYRRLRPPGYRL